MALSQTQVSQLYVSIFGRASEGEGNTFWQQSDDMVSAATEMLASEPAVNYFGDTLTDNQAFIEHIYLNTLGKTYAEDTEGVDYWVGRLDDGESKGTIIADLIVAAQAPENAGDAQDQFNNKVAVSDYVANHIETVADPFEFDDFIDFIDDVDHTDASVAEAEAEIDDALNPPEPGDTFTLTSGTDRGADFEGTSNDDLFDAPIVQNAFAGGVSNSLSSADELDGGAGFDTLQAELVQEFFGVTGDNQIDVQPDTTNIEKALFEARDVALGSINANPTITVDAKHMTDIDEIGSWYSDGDLIIENLTTLESNGNIRNTDAITVVMDHTDNFNSDNDASDLTVYFDEDYLLSGQSRTTSQANYWLLDEDSQDYTNEPLLNIERDGVTLTIDGEAVEIRMDTAIAEAANSWDAFAAALQDRIDEMVADGSTVLEGITVEVDDTNTDQTYNDFGNLVTIPAITLIDSQGRELVPTGFTSPEEATGEFDIFGRFDNEEAQLSDDPVTVNIDLEKAGRDGEGGNLVVGGKNQDVNGDTDVDQVDGIEVFNISVLGDEDKPSNMGRITSTNQALEVINIETDDAYDNGDTFASLTIRGEAGDLDAEPGATPFGGSATNTIEMVNAADFLGDLTIGNVNAAQNLLTLTATGGGDVNFTGIITEVIEPDGIDADLAYNYTTGSGEDIMTVTLGGDAIDTIGESFSVSTGGNDDAVNITMTPGVSFQTMAELDNLSINTGSGADTVNLDAYGTFDIKTADGSDFVRINSVDANGNATTGIWTFGDPTGPQDFERVLYQAELTVSFAGFEETVSVETDAAGNFIATQMDINDAIKEAIDNNEELSQLLTYTDGTGNQSLTITSNVGGQNTLAIALYQPHIADDGVDPVAGEVSLADADETALAQGLIDTGVVADSDDVDTTAEIITEMNGISGSIDQDGVGDTATYTDITNDVAEVVPDGGNDIFDDAAPADLYQAYNNGGSSDATTGINFSTINLGNGSNDLVVLHSNDNSVNILEIDDVFGKASVVNFHDVSTDLVASAADVGNHALDFSAFLDDIEDVSDNDPNTQSEAAIVTTVNNVTGATAFADSAAGSDDAAANSVNIIRFDGDADADDVFADLDASTLVAALNDVNDDGTTDFGNLTGGLLTPILDAQLVGSTENHIIMVENDQNEGEYKVFHLTSTWDTDAGETTSVSDTNGDDLFDLNATELGTLDFGASVNLNVVNAQVDTNDDGVLDTFWSAFLHNQEALADGDTVENTAPVATNDAAAFEVTAGETVTIDAATLLANDTDADGDTLTIAGVTQLNPADGTATLSEDGLTITFTAADDFAGNASFAYTVTDGTDTSTPATVSGTVTEAANTAPVATNDAAAFEVTAGETVTIDAATLLANDTDADGDTLTIAGVTQLNPADGTATLSEDGLTITFTAADDFAGNASFAYTVTDGTDTSTSATVTGTVTAAGETAIEMEDGNTYAATAEADIFAYDFSDYTGGNYGDTATMVGTDGTVTITGFDATMDVIRFVDSDGDAPTVADFTANGYAVVPNGFAGNTTVQLTPYQGEAGDEAAVAADIVLQGVVLTADDITIDVTA